MQGRSPVPLSSCRLSPSRGFYLVAFILLLLSCCSVSLPFERVVASTGTKTTEETAPKISGCGVRSEAGRSDHLCINVSLTSGVSLAIGF